MTEYGVNPRSEAYVTSPGAVEVTAAGVMVAYAQVHMLELISLGVERREASRLGWELFHSLIAATGARSSSPVDPAERGRVNCLGLSAAGTAEALAMPIEEFRSKLGGRRAPVAKLHPADRDRAVWLLDAVKRVAHGVAFDAAMRQASDAAVGKPRQRREPAASEFITGELEACLVPLWWCLCHARTASGRFWLRTDVDDDARPRADHLVRPQPAGSSPADPGR